MHIVLLNDDALATAKGGAKGGAVVIVDNLRRSFAAAGHTVTFITTHRSESTDDIVRTEDASGATISIGVSYPLKHRHRMCLRIPHVSAHLQNLLSELKPDVVNAHNIHTYLTYDSLRVARKHTNTIFLTAHDTYLVSFDRVRGAAYERLALQGNGWRMHWWNHVASAGRKYWPLRNPTIRSILRKNAVQVIGISVATKRFLEVNGIPVSAVIRNGIPLPTMPTDHDVVEFRRTHGLTGPTILFAGRIREDKGIGALLDAATIAQKEISNLHILVAGDRVRMERFLRERPAFVRSMVTTTDWLSQEEMPLCYCSADIVAVPSLYLDNFPTVNLEASAFKRPIIGTPFGGTPEAVLDRETGIIENPKNTEAFAQAIMMLVRDKAAQERMGQKGRERIAGEFTLQKQGEHYLSLFAERNG
ncbi:MAG TPA: glycosyltransferase family 4 protein [Candidatus Peribacterales bacterium]|nr:glycosyltransferase family 4 protein [Candidatus Peribacterales bacterium]